MLPNLGLTDLVKQASEGPAMESPAAEESQERAPARPKRQRVLKVRQAADRSETCPFTVWLKPTTWQRAKLAACRKNVSASEIVEGALLSVLPDLVLSERAA